MFFHAGEAAPSLRAAWQRQRVVNHTPLSLGASGGGAEYSRKVSRRIHLTRFSRFSRDPSISLDVAQIQISYSLRATRDVGLRGSSSQIFILSSASLFFLFFFQVREAQLMRVAINRRDTQNFKCLAAHSGG